MISKLPGFSDSIFAIMTPLANQYKAINMSQGFPDFNASTELLELMNHYIRQGPNSYAPMPGTIELRERLSEKYLNLHQYFYDPGDEITITAGATQAIYTAITAVVHPNDEVIVFEPVFDTYVPSIELCGGKSIPIKLNPLDFSIPWDEVFHKTNQHTRLVIINSPHNPSGYVFKVNDFINLSKLFTLYPNLILLSDEVHEHIVYEPNHHISACSIPELVHRTIIVGSFGKTFHGTGWKIGYALAPHKIMNEFRKIHQNVVFAVNHPLQLALAEFMKNPHHYLDLPSFYKEKRDLFLSHLQQSRFHYTPCEGTFFQLLNFADICKENDKAFAFHLTKEFGIASIPVSVFYSDLYDGKILRFCFAKNEETIIKAAEILCKI